MVFLPNGNVGVGTINPVAKLEVMGNTIIHGDVTVIKDNLGDATRMTLGGNGAQGYWDYTSLYLKGYNTGDTTSGAGTGNNDPYTHWNLSHRIGTNAPGIGEESDNSLMLSFFKGGNNSIGGNYTAGIVITPNITPGKNVTSTVAINKASPPNKAYALDVVGGIYTTGAIRVGKEAGSIVAEFNCSVDGSIAYYAGHFFGCAAGHWKQLDN